MWGPGPAAAGEGQRGGGRQYHRHKQTVTHSLLGYARQIDSIQVLFYRYRVCIERIIRF